MEEIRGRGVRNAVNNVLCLSARVLFVPSLLAFLPLPAAITL